MPIDKGDREPKLTSSAELAARVVPSRRGCSDLSVRGVVRGKTSTPLVLAQLLAQRADNQLLITDVEALRPASLLRDLPQAYAPIHIDCPPSSGYPAGGPVWEEALRVLGLPDDCDPTHS